MCLPFPQLSMLPRNSIECGLAETENIDDRRESCYLYKKAVSQHSVNWTVVEIIYIKGMCMDNPQTKCYRAVGLQKYTHCFAVVN